MHSKWIALSFLPLLTACGAASLDEQHARADQAVGALRRGEFVAARNHADQILHSDSNNPDAALVRAIARYEKTMHRVALDVRTLVVGAALGGLNEPYFRSSLEQGEKGLVEVDRDLEIVERDENFSVDLCVACWEIDWNGNGHVDDRDRMLFQIEQDADGKPIPADDPRRKPTFRFDHGDVHWARAFVAFQRAAIDVALAYDWQALNELREDDRGHVTRIRIRLAHPDRIRAARDLILAGLHQSDEARKAYLAETDDEREWLPNPRQKSHALPLPVDRALYETWQGVIGDLERLIRGEEGLRLADLEPLEERKSAPTPAQGYLDISQFFSNPKDIVVDLRELERLDRKDDMEGLAKTVFGSAYVRKMKQSPLPGRLLRMKTEIDRREEPLERKLRYLFWIN